MHISEHTVHGIPVIVRKYGKEASIKVVVFGGKDKTQILRRNEYGGTCLQDQERILKEIHCR